jgi:hypothetical protein
MLPGGFRYARAVSEITAILADARRGEPEKLGQQWDCPCFPSFQEN